MQSIKREIPDFDDLEELVAESTRTVTASTVEDLDDLDTLLEESTALASAKRAQKQGRKLTDEQNELLEADPSDAKAIAELQRKANCARGSVLWLREAIDAGDNALKMLETED